jgi:hypothetical protein
MKFYERPDCVTLSPYVDAYGTQSGIFVFKNIIPQDLLEKIESELKAVENQNQVYDDTLISWYSEKISPVIPSIFPLWEFMSELIGPEWVIHPQNNMLIVKPGDNGMFIHTDSPGKGQCNLLSQVDVWSTCCELDYGVVAYFGDFEGGAIFYPHINPDGTVKKIPDDGPCFEYTPQKGDIVIHSAFYPYQHGVREVTSGIRYAYSNFSLKAIDNPGTFYNYGTPEYYEQVGNKDHDHVVVWMTPLITNPQFTHEKIKEYQAAGVEGEELSEKFFQHVDKEEFRKHLKKSN